MSAPGVSIAIVVRNQAPLLFRCLSALAKLPDEPAFEVLVVDDGSFDETAAALASVEGDLHTLRNEYPTGFGPACDQAVAMARGEHVVLLRPDAVPADGWLEPLVDLLDAAPQADAARPRAVDLRGSDDGEAFWPCLALRRAAYMRVGGFAGSAVSGRAEKATLLERLTVADVPTALVLTVPEDVVLPAAA